MIVSTARTPIGRAFKGTLVDVDPFDLAEHVVRAAVERSGLDPRSSTTSILAESLHGGGDIARYVAVEAGLEHVPGAAVNRHCAAGLTAVTIAAGSHRRRHGPRRRRRRHPVDVHLAPASIRVPGTADQVELDVAQPPPDRPTAPALDMSITVGLERRRRGRRHPRGDGRLGLPLAPAGRRRHRRGPLRRGDRPDRGQGARRRHPLRRRRAPAPRHDDREARRARRRCTPRSRASASPPATRRASTTAPPPWSSPTATRRRRGAHAAGDRAVLGLGRRRPRAHRPGAHRRHPQGARAGRHQHRRRRPVGDQRGVRLDVRGHLRHPRHRRRAGQRRWAAAAASATRSP